VFTTQKESSIGTERRIVAAARPMRVHVVDPPAYTPPYDHALCGALARAGARVTLVTSRFAYGAVPRDEGYAIEERFYRLGAGRPGSRARSAIRLAQHVPGMLGYRRAARAADVVHFQWLAAQPLDVHLLPGGRPVVLTAHDVLPREPRRGQLTAQRRLYDRVDAVVVHSEYGRARLTDELGVEPAKVHVIPHGAFEHLRAVPQERPLPPELATAGGPVVLFFGLVRPYKGVDVLLEAWRGIEGAELWVVGMPRMDLAALKAAAPSSVRFVERFVEDAEVAALFRRADLVVLPYREIDQSGVLFTALAFGRPLVLSDVGGFAEVAATGAAELVPAGDPVALRAALRALLADPAARERLAAASARAAAERYGWDDIARRHLALYATLAR
jgi:glycosyltransferase involved in cell wall biosynthesis